MSFYTFLAFALLLSCVACNRTHPAAQPAVEVNETKLALQKSEKIARRWEADADVVFTTHGMTNGAVQLVRPMTTSNVLVTASDFQSVLAPISRRELALIEMYAVGFDTNGVTNAAAQLRQCGFRDVRAVVLRWGGRYTGPTL